MHLFRIDTRLANGIALGPGNVVAVPGHVRQRGCRERDREVGRPGEGERGVERERGSDGGEDAGFHLQHGLVVPSALGAVYLIQVHELFPHRDGIGLHDDAVLCARAVFGGFLEAGVEGGGAVRLRARAVDGGRGARETAHAHGGRWCRTGIEERGAGSGGGRMLAEGIPVVDVGPARLVGEFLRRGEA